MGLIERRIEKGKQLGLWDWILVKLALIIIGIIIGAYISDFVKTYLWYLIAIVVILLIIIEYRLSKKTKGK